MLGRVVQERVLSSELICMTIGQTLIMHRVANGTSPSAVPWEKGLPLTRPALPPPLPPPFSSPPHFLLLPSSFSQWDPRPPTNHPLGARAPGHPFQWEGEGPLRWKKSFSEPPQSLVRPPTSYEKNKKEM